jgi:hypothetical protein
MQYDDDLADRICAEIAQDKTFSQIERMPGFPRAQTMRNWLATRPEFAKKTFIAATVNKDAVQREKIQALLEQTPEELAKKYVAEGMPPFMVKTLISAQANHNYKTIDYIIEFLKYDNPEKYSKTINLRGSMVPSHDLKTIMSTIIDNFPLILEALSPEQFDLMKRYIEEFDNAVLRPKVYPMQEGNEGQVVSVSGDTPLLRSPDDDSNDGGSRSCF